MSRLLEPPGRDAPDLRLALPAVAAWLVAWQGRFVPPRLLGGLALGVVFAAAVVLRRSRQARSVVVAATLVAAAAAGVATAVRVHLRTDGPLVDAASRSASVTVEGVLLDDPRLVPSKGEALAVRDLVIARLRVEQVDFAGRAFALRQPVLVLASDRAWLGLLPSQRVRTEGRLEQADRGDDVAALLSARGPPVVQSGPSRVHRVAGVLRQGLRDAVRPLPAEERGLLPGLVDGDTGQLDPALKQDFQSTGLSHLTAVSGTNVAIVLGAVLAVCGWLRIGLRWRAPLATLALLGFVVLARPSPSVLRAGAMGLVAILALATGSRRQAAPALCAAVIGLLLLSPELAAQPGFALSTFATAALILVAPVWRDRMARRMPRWLAEAIAVPAAAQLACTPVVVAISGSLGLLAIPANLLVIPAVAPATVLGVLAALLAPLSLPVAQAVAWVAYMPVHWLVVVAHAGADQPGAGASLPQGWLGVGLVGVLMATGVVVLRSPRLRRAAAAATVGVLAATVVVVAVRPPWPPPGWLLVSCDVGQGDAYVVSLGSGSALVVDVGPDPKPIDGCLRRLGIRRIPLLVLTHLHADHVEGVPGALRDRQVGQVQIGPLDEPRVELERLTGWLAARQIPMVRAAIGEVRQSGAVRWEVLDATARRGTASDPNNSSIVQRLVTHGVSVLFAGDLEGEAQSSLVDRGLDLRADVLKIPHHGSRKQDPTFLDSVQAKVALTPVGAGNPYGHPDRGTLTRLEDQGTRIYRSDLDGDVAVLLRDGTIASIARGGEGSEKRAMPSAHHPTVASMSGPPALGFVEALLPADSLTRCDVPIADAPARGPPRHRLRSGSLSQ